MSGRPTWHPTAEAPALNRRLHALLRRACGRVLVANQGQAAGRPVRDPLGRTDYDDPGEYYRVSCPYCNDTESKLWVSHRWCAPDPLRDGEKLRHLAICYKSGCLATRYGEFEELVFGFRPRSPRDIPEMRILEGRPPEDAPGPEPLPSDAVPLAEVDRRHPAALYLEGRGFDPRALGREYGLCYTPGGAGHRNPGAVRNRIIAPVTHYGEPAGWQGRYAGDVDWKKHQVPKYYSACRKSRLLYGGDRARELSPRMVVVVEGVTDVWAGGPGFVATFGKEVSSAQRDLLGEWAGRGGLLVLMFDPGAWTTEVDPSQREQAARKHDRLMHWARDEFAANVLEIDLPGGKDPGQYDRRFLWRVIRARADAAGFRLARFQ